ncbi:hypothetical protein LG302_01085 [Halomonas organivorans]
MDDATRYRLTVWRKRLEARGWIGLRRAAPIQHKVVEYHVIWQNRLISGRARLADFDQQRAIWEPGSAVYLLERQQDVWEGVWRVARDQQAPVSQVVRRMPR